MVAGGGMFEVGVGVDDCFQTPRGEKVKGGGGTPKFGEWQESFSRRQMGGFS